MYGLHDMHCHLDFMANAEEVASDAQARGMLVFANTVTPDGYIAARQRFAAHGNVAVGFGMHPWWVERASDETASAPRQAASQRAEHKRLAQANELSNPQREAENAQMRAGVIRALDEADPPLIGEVGLDFGWRHAPSRLAQEAMLADIARWAARHGGRVMSLHSIRSARETLDILERAEALAACTCVFHWFSGPSDQLKRAIDAGCFFSCGTRMLATGKGREYVKAIPAERLLLETDAPPEQGTAYSYEEMRGELERVANAIAAIKGQSALETIARTSERLLGVIS